MLTKISSFFFVLSVLLGSFFGVQPARYSVCPLFADPQFAEGFTVIAPETQDGQPVPTGSFLLPQSSGMPVWTIAQWHTKGDLWAERIPADDYTLTDGATKTVRVDPAQHSVALTLNAANVYGGASADYDTPWPHLLLEQSPLVPAAEDAAAYRCDAAHIVLTLEVRMPQYTPSTNPEGVNATQFLAYFYLQGVSTDDFVWFGVNLFDDRGHTETTWSMDTAGSNRMIYTIADKETFFPFQTLWRFGKPFVSKRWRHVRLDLTPYIDDMLQKANEENLFGRQATRGEFYISGANIGFEIHGNSCCTVEIKDFQLYSCR